MPTTIVTAKRDLLPAFKTGDTLTIEPILYEVDTVICNEIHGWFSKEDGSLFKSFCRSDRLDFHIEKKYEKRSIWPEVVAKAGSVKGYRIINSEGVKYPGSLVRVFSEYFEKVK